MAQIAFKTRLSLYYDYYVDRERFHDFAIRCTLICFAFAWWDLQHSKARSEDSSAYSSESMQTSPAT